MFMKFLVKIKKCFDLSNYSVKSDKYETDVAAIEMLVGLKPKMYSFQVADGSAYKKRELKSCCKKNTQCIHIFFYE